MFTFFFSIEAGVAFQRGSHLELQTPPQLKELAVNTHIRLYFNVTGNFLKKKNQTVFTFTEFVCIFVFFAFAHITL